MQQGGRLLGLGVDPARALVISEESLADWRPRFRELGIRDGVDLLCRPFSTPADRDQWLALIEAAALLHDRKGTALVVIDSLGKFLPGHSENSASAMRDCLTPLERLAGAGMSVLLVHHPHKGKTLAGQAARGSGALPSFADIIIEMGYYTRPDDVDRRRRLVAYSRHEETPRHLLIELQADGRDYAVLQTGPEAAGGEGWQAVVDVLATAHRKLTRQEVLDEWPDDADKPDPTSLWRWLSRAVACGQVQQEGTRRPRDPCRYWLRGCEELLRPDRATPEELQAWNDRCVAELLDRLKPTTGVPPAADAGHPAREEVPPAETGSSAGEATGVPEPALPAQPRPEPAASPGPSPDPSASPAAEPLTPVARDPTVRLPWPYSLMNPAEVPEAVWRRARAAQQNR